MRVSGVDVPQGTIDVPVRATLSWSVTATSAPA
jgi:hypothetical protein